MGKIKMGKTKDKLNVSSVITPITSFEKIIEVEKIVEVPVEKIVEVEKIINVPGKQIIIDNSKELNTLNNKINSINDSLSIMKADAKKLEQLINIKNEEVSDLVEGCYTKIEEVKTEGDVTRSGLLFLQKQHQLMLLEIKKHNKIHIGLGILILISLVINLI